MTPPWLRACALLTLIAFVTACTQQRARAPVPERAYQVDWSAVPAEVLAWDDGTRARGVVLTPAQWPLEVSLKRLLQGDFAGVVEGVDLSFQSSQVPEGVLEDLYDAGYLPVYVRIENTTAEPRPFHVARLAARVDDDVLLTPVHPDTLPAQFREIDWAQTGMAVVVVALVVLLLVAAAKEGEADPGLRLPNLPLHAAVEHGSAPPAGAGATPAQPRAPRPPDAGLLWEVPLAPGEAREGFVLVPVPDVVTDWSTAQVVRVP